MVVGGAVFGARRGWLIENSPYRRENYRPQGAVIQY
jgi:hypothetical protein